MVKTDKDFWDQRYKDKQTGWDINQVSPPIKNYIDTLSDTEISILIPGCGKAYEAEYLVIKRFQNVTVIDIAPTLVNKLKKKFAGKPIKILNGDFFEHTGKYDLILEQTFFCAIDPSMRKEYVKKCFSLLKKGGKIAGLLFSILFEKEGPPYGGTKEEYKTLFHPTFTLKQFDACKTSIAPRLGNELFIELEKKPV
jgi:hypothetical protein